jgi:hypothetical protein
MGAVGGLVVVVGFTSFKYSVSRKRLLLLKWSDDLGFYKFRALVSRYLRYHGWSCRALDSAPFCILAEKQGSSVMLLCVSSEVALNRNSIKELEASKVLAGKHPFVVIYANQVAKDAKTEAWDRSLFVLHYSEMKDFAQLSPPTKKEIITYLERRKSLSEQDDSDIGVSASQQSVLTDRGGSSLGDWLHEEEKARRASTTF